jgi:predicted transcriptional regulator
VVKVKKFLIKTAKDAGSLLINMRVDEIAFHSGVTLATAHKALQALSDEGFLEIERATSRRYSNSYHISTDIEIEEKKMTLEEDLTSTKQENKILMEQIIRLRTENARLRESFKH